MANIPGLDKLLRMDNNFDDGDDVGSDLEDELNAILEGRAFSKPKQTQNSLSGAAPSSRRSRAGGPSTAPPQRHGGSSKPARAAPQMSFDFDDIEKLAQYHGDEDDEDIDESELNDESLLQELQGIVSSPVITASQQPMLPPRPVPAAKPSFKPPTEPVPDYEDPNPVLQRRVAPPPPPSRPERELPSSSSQAVPGPSQQQTSAPTDDRGRLMFLRDGYKKAALHAKKCGNTADAMSSIKIAKQLDIMITAIGNGQPVEMTNLPPPAEAVSVADAAPTRAARYPVPPPAEDGPSDEQFELPEIPPEEPDDGEKLFGAPKAAESVLEALQQRLEKFKSTQAQAQAENNTSKIRRIGRIVKQYETAIKAHKAGKEYDYESLPNPPGYAPIPLPSNETAAPPAAPPVAAVQPKPKAPAPQPPVAAPRPPPRSAPPPPPAAAVVDPRSRLARANSTHNKQLGYLVERQQMFKEAALEAKRKGDISQAKEYLRQARGFDPLIEATKNGLPIDATSIPTPPQLGDDFVMVSHADDASEFGYESTERDEMFRKVEVELNAQIEMCKRNKDHFLALGDVTSSSKFDRFAVDSIKELDMLRARWVNNDKLPRFRYETRTFSIVVCNPELGTNEASVEVIKAIDLPGKNDIDTYVKVEFPFPTETPQTAKTHTAKDNINPVYKELFKFDIDRKSRSLVRIFKRHPIKLEVWLKGGFLRSDTLLGTAAVKLTDFESKCTLHDSYPLMDGRRVVGGKVEAKIRVREPLLAKQVEEVKEKWLVFE